MTWIKFLAAAIDVSVNVVFSVVCSYVQFWDCTCSYVPPCIQVLVWAWRNIAILSNYCCKWFCMRRIFMLHWLGLCGFLVNWKKRGIEEEDLYFVNNTLFCFSKYLLSVTVSDHKSINLVGSFGILLFFLLFESFKHAWTSKDLLKSMISQTWGYQT